MYVQTTHVDKVVELEYFCANIIQLFRYTDRLFLVCFLFAACCNIITASWEAKKERLIYREKSYLKITWVTSLSWLHAIFSMSSFVAFFVYSLPLPNWRTCWMSPIKIHYTAMALFKAAMQLNSLCRLQIIYSKLNYCLLILSFILVNLLKNAELTTQKRWLRLELNDYKVTMQLN